MGTWESYRRLHSDEAHPDVLTVVHNLAGMLGYFFLTFPLRNRIIDFFCIFSGFLIEIYFL